MKREEFQSRENDMNITKKMIDSIPVGRCNDICLIGDLDGDGQEEIVIGAKFYDKAGECQRASADFPNLVYYKWPDWTRHVIGYGELEAGGLLMDLTGNGLPDIIAGEEGRGKNLYWWENTGDHSKPWKRRLITSEFERYHDQACGDLDGDGKDELLFFSQNKSILAYYSIPDDPRSEPWGEEHCHVIATDFLTEGLQIVDIDQDGKNEIIAGHHILRPQEDPAAPWIIEKLLPHLEWARVHVADFNNDGHLDILLAEAENPGARMLWIEGPDFKKIHDMGNDYYHLHTLEVGDFTGNGHVDIIAAEMHLGREDVPKFYLFKNNGKGEFEKTTFPHETGNHEGKIISIAGEALPALVSKPFAPFNEIALLQLEKE